MPEEKRTAQPPAFIWSLVSGYFAMGVASLSVVGLLEPMVVDLGVSRGKIAFLVTFFALAYGFAAPSMQVSVGHFDRRKLIIAGLLIVFAGCLIAAVSQSYALVSASRVLMALGAALVGPMVSAATANLVAPEIRGKALGTAFAGLTLATVFGVPVTTFGGRQSAGAGGRRRAAVGDLGVCRSAVFGRRQTREGRGSAGGADMSQCNFPPSASPFSRWLRSS